MPRDEDLAEDLQQNTAFKSIHGSDGPETTRLVVEWLLQELDADKVHHWTHRVLHAGWEEVETSGWAQTADGERLPRGGTSFRPLYDFVADPHYQSLAEQKIELAKWINSLGVGTRIVVAGGRVWRERVRKPEPVAPWGMRSKLTRWWQWMIQETPFYAFGNNSTLEQLLGASDTSSSSIGTEHTRKQLQDLSKLDCTDRKRRQGARNDGRSNEGN